MRTRPMTTTVQVIINADDFGISQDVNRAIVELLDRERITSATIMANAPAFDDAVRHVARLSHCSFGVHLNLTEFGSLTRHAGFGDYLDAAGSFRGELRARRLDAAFRAAVSAEWSAQIERVLAAGVPVSHLDSHHHTHTIPQLFPCLHEVRRRFGIRRVRISRNLYARGGLRRRVNLVSKSVWNGALRHYAGASTTDRFTDFGDFVALAGRLRSLPRTIELMVHPGGPQSAVETALLTSDWRTKLPFPTELVSYHAL
jgi:chitin disaccharide deacetylase